MNKVGNTLIGCFKCLLFDAFQSIKWKQDVMFSLNVVFVLYMLAVIWSIFSLKFKAPILNGKTVETLCNDCVRNHLFVCYILCSVTYFNQSWCWFCCWPQWVTALRALYLTSNSQSESLQSSLTVTPIGWRLAISLTGI